MKTVKFNALLGVVVVATLVSDGVFARESDYLTPRVAPVTARDLGMARYKIARDDRLLWIFNGHGKCNPRRYSLTGFNGLSYASGMNYVEGDSGYRFHIDFREKRSGTLIQDNVPEVMDTDDPLGWNFRAGAPLCLLTQDETWYPHFYKRTGTFHKHFKTGTVSFAIETRTFASAKDDEVLLAMDLENRDTEPLTLTLLPVQNGQNLLQVPGEGGLACVVTDLEAIKGQGLEWTIPPKTRQTHNFAISVADKGKEPPVYQPNLADRVRQADLDGEAQIRQIADPLPAIKTQSRQLDDFYKRCITSMAFCRWQRDHFRNKPTWSIGGIMCIVSWDFSFASESLALIEPQAIRQILRDVLDIGQMKSSYIGLKGREVIAPYLYIQEPFAMRDLIEGYITITGDRTILDDQAGGMTVYEWLKRWGDKLNEFAKGPDGLIDLGDANELLLELRTDDYDHVVPAVNGLAVEYYRWLAQLANERNDTDAVKFTERAEALNKAFHEKLWNEKAGWFDNLYADGSRQPFFTAHLFDLLGTSAITDHERQAIAAHIQEGEFLGEFGMYSISKKDSVHWDRLDADWGGGGCYVGTPLRTARYLYEHGEDRCAWNILKRMIRLADHFAFLPQSPMADEPNEFRTGGNLEISAAAGLDAVWFGIFGLRPKEDGSLRVSPAPFNPEIGEATLAGFQFRRHRYDVQLLPTGYRVFLDSKLWSQQSYTKNVTIPAQSP